MKAKRSPVGKKLVAGYFPSGKNLPLMTQASEVMNHPSTTLEQEPSRAMSIRRKSL